MLSTEMEQLNSGMNTNRKPYKTNTIAFYGLVVIAILYFGFSIMQGGQNYRIEKKAITDEYREEYIQNVDSFRALEEEQLDRFLHYYENQEAGTETRALMEKYAEDLLTTQNAKMKFYSSTEPPPAFVGFQAQSYLATSMIADGLKIMLVNIEDTGIDFESGVLMLEEGIEMSIYASERYNVAKNFDYKKTEVENSN